MKIINDENTARLTFNLERGLTLFRNGRGSPLLVAAALWIGMASATSYAQTVIGSPGAGFQHWTVGDLNNNGAPYWDAVTKSAGNTPNSANVGFCLTGTGDCGGIISHPPGPVPFWGMSFNSGTDTPATGAMDPKVYFHHSSSEHGELKATLERQFTTSAEPKAINEIGWFETNASGTVIGTKHVLFRGAGNPVGSTIPDPVEKKLNSNRRRISATTLPTSAKAAVTLTRFRPSMSPAVTTSITSWCSRRIPTRVAPASGSRAKTRQGAAMAIATSL